MLYKIKKKDIDKAADILGRSFFDYPIFKYMLPDDQYRKSKIDHLFRFLIKLGMNNGEVVAPSKSIEGVCIWINPSNVNAAFINGFRAGIISLFIAIDSKSFKRFCEFGSKVERIRANILQDNNYYLLDAIGIDSQYQRQGFARMLIESKLLNSDKINSQYYLETSDPNNIDFYKKFGFALINEYEIYNIRKYCLLLRPNI